MQSAAEYAFNSVNLNVCRVFSRVILTTTQPTNAFVFIVMRRRQPPLTPGLFHFPANRESLDADDASILRRFCGFSVRRATIGDRRMKRRTKKRRIPRQYHHRLQ